MKHILRSFFVLVFGIHTVLAQDAQLSMYTSTPLELNPAVTGFFQNNEMRAWLNYRSQWGTFLDKGINTSNFSFDMPIPQKKIGVGVHVLNNTATKGSMKDLQINFSTGYTTKLDERSGQHLAFGLQFGMKQKSFDENLLTWGEQYNEITGYNSGSDNGENYGLASKTYFDVSAGGLWFIDDNWKVFKPWVGLGAYHLTRPNESFESSNVGAIQETRLPSKFVTHLGAEIIVNDLIDVTPSFMYANQGNVNQFNLGGYATFKFNNDKHDTSVDLGSYWRTRDAVVAMVGFKFSEFGILFEYEVNTSDLTEVSKGYGGVEFTLLYIKNSKAIKNPKFL